LIDIAAYSFEVHVLRSVDRRTVM